MKYVIALCILLLFSCNMGKQYANHRYGGKSKEKINQNEVLAIDSDSVFLFEPEFSETNFRDSCLKNANIKYDFNSDEVLYQPIVRENVNTFFPYEGETKTDSTAKEFEIDEELSQAFASPAVNVLAGIFGLLASVQTNFAWVAIVFYIAVPIAAVIGIICFSIALNRYAKGKIDARNKKFLWLWILTFLVTLLLAALVLMITL